MRGSLTQRALVASLTLGAVIVGCFVVLAVAFASLQTEEHHDDQAADVVATSNALEVSVLNLETGLRGYLMRGRTLFLQPYRAALAVYPGQIRQLDQLTAGTPSPHGRAVRLGDGVTAYVRGWTMPVIRKSSSDLWAAQLMEAGGGGKLRVDALRRQFGALNRQEAAIAASQRRASDRTGRVTFVLGFAGLVLAALLIAGLAIGLRRGVAVPVNRLADAVSRLRRGDLSARVAERGLAEMGQLAVGFNAMAGELEAARDEVENQNAELQGQQAQLHDALASVERGKEEAETLHHFGEQLAAQTQIEAVAKVTLREIADYARAQVGAVYVLNEQARAITFRAGRGTRAGDFMPELPPGQGLAGRALAEQQPITVQAPETSMQLPGLVSDRQIQHELHLPLLHRDRAIGVVSLGRSSGEEFTPAEVAVLAGLAQSAALACAEALSLRRLEVAAGELQVLMDSTDEGIYRRDLDGRITFINRAALEQTGYTEAEMLGQNAHQMLHHTYEDGRPYPAAECPLWRTVEERAGSRFAGDVFWRKDGTPFPVECSAVPLFDGEAVTGIVVTFHDVSDTKLAERQLAAQYRTARVLAEADSIEDALPRLLKLCCEELGWQVAVAWAADGDDGELHCRAAHARAGWADQLALLSHETVLLGQGTVGQAWQRREPVAVPRPAGPAQPRVDGQPKTIETIVAQLSQFADRKRSEAATSRVKDQFVATVSHELRTPLAAMDGWLHILLDGEPGPLNEEQRRFLTTVKRNSDRLMRLVGDLLLIGQMDAGRFALDLGDVDLAELAGETAALFEGAATEKGIELTADAGAPAMVHGDRLRLGQLLGNLVSNAVKFTPEGGQVRVRVGEQRGACQVEVTDSGIGIPAEERAQLFERFDRASTATGTPGSGLGLAISKTIAEAHGGTIRIADSGGRGTRFVLEIPLHVTAEVSL